MFQVFAALPEFKRSVIKERTIAGLAAARARGRKGGRPRSVTEEDIAAARAMLNDTDITVDDLAQHLGVGPATLYRHLPGDRRGIGEAAFSKA
nr:helix-turn-helix domain-containing protein [uncultured Rhodopila sp.]